MFCFSKRKGVEKYTIKIYSDSSVEGIKRKEFRSSAFFLLLEFGTIFFFLHDESIPALLE